MAIIEKTHHTEYIVQFCSLAFFNVKSQANVFFPYNLKGINRYISYSEEFAIYKTQVIQLSAGEANVVQ